MMGFQNLRNNNSVYILHKNGTPYLEIGKITNVTPPIPRYGSQFNEMTVDLSMEVNKSPVNFQKVPANQEIADVDSDIVISCNKHAISDEVKFMRQRSEDIINSIEQHEQIIAGCDDIIKVLNPEIAEKEARDKETQALKDEIKSLKDMILEFTKELKA